MPHAPLRLETLESRDVPAITIQLDYTYDNGFFTSRPEARAVLERVAGELSGLLTANLSAITPTVSNNWTATFFNPSGDGQISLSNLSIGADTLRVFVGAKTMSGNEEGIGGPGGYALSGSKEWIGVLQTRGHNGYAPWGGSLAFDSSANWFVGQTTAGLNSSQIDFYSVALHEMGHLLGIGTAPQWTAAVSGSTYTGANAESVYGGPVPLNGDGAHWANGLTVNGQLATMDPVLMRGTRVGWGALDTAALRDLGWTTADGPAAAPVTKVPLASQSPIAFTGNADGTVSLFTSANGALTDTGTRLTPFIGYRGAIRVTSGDFNGDGVTDYAFTTGAGPQAVVQIMNGRDGSLLVNQRVVFPGFMGGLFLAAADIDGDGAADLVISADAGAGPHIQTFRVTGGDLVLQSSFFAFDNPAYTGGARVAAGDINRDGYADVVVATGGQATGRVAVYSGADLRKGVVTRLMPDFLPFGGLWAGLNVAVGDMNGDGYAELAVTPDRGGPPHVKIWSGATLAANLGAQASALPLTASFYGLTPGDLSGARLALRDTNGDGRAELFVTSENPRNSVARTFTYDMVLAGGAGAGDALPFNTLATYDGVYAGLHSAEPTTPTGTEQHAQPVAAETPTTGGASYTVTVPPATHKCTCPGCRILAALAGDPSASADLLPTIPV